MRNNCQFVDEPCKWTSPCNPNQHECSFNVVLTCNSCACGLAGAYFRSAGDLARTAACDQARACPIQVFGSLHCPWVSSISLSSLSVMTATNCNLNSSCRSINRCSNAYGCHLDMSDLGVFVSVQDSLLYNLRQNESEQTRCRFGQTIHRCVEKQSVKSQCMSPPLL